MTWKLSGFLAVVFLLATGAPPGAAAPAAPTAPASALAAASAVATPDATRDDTPDDTPAADTGAIEGVLTIERTPARRTVDRYGGSGSSRPVQEIAPVVYLKGAMGSAGTGSGDVTMAQRDTAFVPGLLVVAVGTTVRFPNQDPFFHNVFSYSSAARFDLGRYPRGESKEVQFMEPGIVKVYCEVHEPMRAVIMVTENRHWAVPDSAGRFTLPAVPAGTHTLVAWHADRGEVEREITVRSGEVVRVELEL